MSQRHLKRGDANPPVHKDVLRIYSMKYCPFAERALLVLTTKGIEHEIVNCNLNEKPEFLLERNPAGTVPVLEFQGNVVPGSLIISDLCEELFPDKPLASKDPYQKAVDRLAVEKFSPVITYFYKAYKNKDMPELMETLRKHLASFQDLLKAKQTPFLGGEHYTMPDLMVYPWLERLMNDVDLMEGFPELVAYSNRMSQVPPVKAIAVPKEEMHEFYKGYHAGKAVYI
ncbi:glutathione S-transferase omega-1-like [Diadema antillarum]|uniref:glutathione S-transferase omega-1-like n=1 Tax=Diadema antillarum TaxID=105358 RepID=UPI003A89914D